MADKFYGVWLPGRGWVRFNRQTTTGGYEMVAWASRESLMARMLARDLGGRVKRIDEALGGSDAMSLLLAAEAARRGILWQIKNKIKAVFHRVSLTN
jgi:hypothetical protein